MKIKVILKLLSTYFFPLVALEVEGLYLEIKVLLRNIPVPCDENIKYNLLLSLKVTK